MFQSQRGGGPPHKTVQSDTCNRHLCHTPFRPIIEYTKDSLNIMDHCVAFFTTISMHWHGTEQKMTLLWHAKLHVMFEIYVVKWSGEIPTNRIFSHHGYMWDRSWSLGTHRRKSPTVWWKDDRLWPSVMITVGDYRSRPPVVIIGRDCGWGGPFQG